MLIKPDDCLFQSNDTNKVLGVCLTRPKESIRFRGYLICTSFKSRPCTYGKSALAAANYISKGHRKALHFGIVYFEIQ